MFIITCIVLLLMFVCSEWLYRNQAQYSSKKLRYVFMSYVLFGLTILLMTLLD
ncbi:hypothetical protein [Helicobacter apodemus]|uniref:hypothetical protein n=1 Tax=Helicobacter apodemus TaxID=135569 RepID=UPI0013A55051|nr:hypothetical protein [Helicobacter apodemus]